MNQPEINNSGGIAKLLNQLNLPALVLVLLLSGTNLLETKSGNDFNAHEIERATAEIHELYPKLNEAIRNQADMKRSLEALEAREKH